MDMLLRAAQQSPTSLNKNWRVAASRRRRRRTPEGEGVERRRLRLALSTVVWCRAQPLVAWFGGRGAALRPRASARARARVAESARPDSAPRARGPLCRSAFWAADAGRDWGGSPRVATDTLWPL